MQSKRNEKLSREDLPAIREAIRSYRDYLKAKGAEPSSFWEERVTEGLKSDGVRVKRPRETSTP